MTVNNQYKPEVGYSGVSGWDSPEKGYGITDNTIMYWFENRNIPIKYQQNFFDIRELSSDIDDPCTDDFYWYLRVMKLPIEIEYKTAEIEYQGKHYGFSAYMYTVPEISDKPQTLPTKKEIDTAILNVLNSIYKIPINLQTNFEEYIQYHIGQIQYNQTF